MFACAAGVLTTFKAEQRGGDHGGKERGEVCSSDKEEARGWAWGGGGGAMLTGLERAMLHGGESQIETNRDLTA